MIGFTRKLRPTVAVAAAALLVLGLTTVPGTATATTTSSTPSPQPWKGFGAGGTVVADGTTSSPQFTLTADPADGLWFFETQATADATVTVPYDLRGTEDGPDSVHMLAITDPSWFPQLPKIVATPVSAALGAGPFQYSGAVTFTVHAGDRYGFSILMVDGFGKHAVSATLTVPTAGFTDPGAVAQNTSWPNAALLTTAGVDGTLTAPGEARWYKFPITPSSQVDVTLSKLAQNYDLTLYGDIGAEFTSLATVNSTTDLNALGAEQSGNAFSPSIYSPSIYSPSIYSPSIYSPSIYSPSIYSPSIYSPSIYSPSIYSPSIYSPSIYSPSIYSPSIYSPSIYSPSQAFLQAFSAAQSLSLMGISANDGTADENISAATWNNTGFFYVRVMGRNGVSSPTPYHLDLAVTGGPCSTITLNSFASDPTLTGTPGAAQAVILTDSSRLSLTTAGLGTDLATLATATHGVVVDVSQSQRVVDLNRQADANPSCAYAKNLVAQAIRDIVNSYRDASGTLKYVAIIGGDSVIPYFRYPDNSGLGPEVDYVPPVLGTSPSQASLQTDDVLGQDAYGAVSDLSIKGSVLPVPDLAVGRLVETPAEIDGQVEQFLGLTNQTLPTPKSSLVTGYDFLTSAADTVESDLQAGLGAGARNDQLITNQGVPTTTTTGASGPSRTTSWTATDLSNSLFSSHHDLVFLAGHFSANNTLAADYSTTLSTTDIAAHPTAFTNSLVFSPGCHSGYNIVDQDGVPGVTLDLDWAQEMAEQKAILIAGTGYQYADTDFLAYSAKLYTQFAHELRAGSAGASVAIGQALVQAKQDYLDGLTSVTGIDEKTVIEASMYGLPMTGIDMPGARTGAATTPAGLTTQPADAGTPGATLGLRTADLQVDTPTSPHSEPILNVNAAPTGASFTWLSGPDGTLTQPAVPALPEQSVDATSSTDASLRGVGFRSGSYTDATGITPLTGAAATEQNGIHTTFASPDFFPQNLFSVNYFDALGASGSGGQTSLILTPAQYRAENATGTTDTQRTYSHLGLSLFYSANTATFGQNTPALAQAPSISQVSSSVGAAGVTFSAHVTGDPSAGIQQVWVTYTGESGPLHGNWASIDLTQDAADSTLWSATLPLPSGQDASAVRFLVQAVNGVGMVGVDDNLGADYTPGVVVGAISPDAAPTQLTLDPVPANLAYDSTLNVGATLTGAPAGSLVNFDIGQGAIPATTDANGHATVSVTVSGTIGPHHVIAVYAGDNDHLSSSAQSPDFTETKAPTTLVLHATRAIYLSNPGGVKPKPPLANIDTGMFVTLTSNGRPLLQKAVLFTLTNVLTGTATSFPRATDLNGQVRLGTIALLPGIYTITASFGSTLAGSTPDPVYVSSTAARWSGVLLPGISVVVAG